MHYGRENLPKPTDKKQEVWIEVKEGDTAWMAGTTSRVYYGPVWVRYTIWPDGGVDDWMRPTKPPEWELQRAKGEK